MSNRDDSVCNDATAAHIDNNLSQDS